MQFIDRAEELAFLERKFASDEAELLIIYGRRRVGKTELLLHFSKDLQRLYFLGRLESRADTLKRLNDLLVERFGDAALLRSPVRSWEAFLDYLGRKAEKRLLVIIDEFPFVVSKFPEVTSVFQDRWDSALKDTKIMLALSGSSVGMMEKHALSKKSPLFGRRTGQWNVRPMPVASLREFFPAYKPEDLVRVFSIVDMIPAYLAKFSNAADVRQNVIDKVLSKGEYLYEEVEILLREEFRDPSNYMSILSAIAGGATTFNEIYNRTQLDKSLLSKYIYVLDRLGIVERVVPVTESYKRRLGARGALHFLRDNFFDFWFRFVYLNKPALEAGQTAEVWGQIEKDLDRYVSCKFERFVASMVPALGIIPVSRQGRWWSGQSEIDAVALDEKGGQALFCECKWSKNVDAEDVLNKVREAAAEVEWRRKDRKEHFAIFAKSFSRRAGGARCYDLQDIMKALG
jgi:AAA+ ATPase superfamily predicted ATPase